MDPFAVSAAKHVLYNCSIASFMINQEVNEETADKAHEALRETRIEAVRAIRDSYGPDVLVQAAAEFNKEQSVILWLERILWLPRPLTLLFNQVLFLCYGDKTVINALTFRQELTRHLAKAPT